MPRTIFAKKSFPRLDFLKAVSVTKIANSEKMKMKKSHPVISVSPTDFLKKNSSRNILKTLSSPLKKVVGGGRKVMCFHLKIYVILLNSVCVFLLEHIDVF